jgi:hypothetical protein
MIIEILSDLNCGEKGFKLQIFLILFVFDQTERQTDRREAVEIKTIKK